MVVGTRDASGRRSGGEGFHATGRPLGFDLLSFWQWSCSDLVGNALRGLVAEYLVARAVKGDGGMYPATVRFADLGEAVSRCASERSLAEGAPSVG